MSTLKTMVVLAVLAMVGYGLYVGLNNGFQFQSGQTETPDWLKEEMHSGGGLPQVAPPQVTPPQPPTGKRPYKPRFTRAAGFAGSSTGTVSFKARNPATGCAFTATESPDSGP